MLPTELHTARLTLRPWSPDDVDDLLAYATDSAWGRFLPVPRPYLREHAVQFIERQASLDRDKLFAWAVVVEGRVQGGINFNRDNAYRAWMGWSIAPALWGRGLTAEAARAVIDAAFDALPSLVRVYSFAVVENTASLRVMDKIGMRREGVLRAHDVLDDTPHDVAYAGLLRSEWSARAKTS